MFRIFKVAILLIPAWISAITSRKYDANKRYLICQKWCKRTLKALDYQLEVEGIENIVDDEVIYFVSNHQGTMDPAIIIAACPVALSFISKIENEKLPLFGSWAKTLNNIHFDRSSREGNIHMLRESARRLKNKQNLLIFPEGTRSKSDNVNEFKVGSTQPASLAKASILPMTLNNAYAFDQKKPKSRVFKVSFGKPIKYEEYKKYSQEDLASFLQNTVKAKVNSN